MPAKDEGKWAGSKRQSAPGRVGAHQQWTPSKPRRDECMECGGAGKNIWDKPCFRCAGSGTAARKSLGGRARAETWTEPTKSSKEYGAPSTPSKAAKAQRRRSTGEQPQAAEAAVRAAEALLLDDGQPRRGRRATVGGESFAARLAAVGMPEVPEDEFPMPHIFGIATPEAVSPEKPCSLKFTPQAERVREEEDEDEDEVNETCDDSADEAAEATPCRPDGLSWDWPLSRPEKVTRLQNVERMMHSLDRRALKQEVSELRIEKRRLSLQSGRGLRDDDL